MPGTWLVILSLISSITVQIGGRCDGIDQPDEEIALIGLVQIAAEAGAGAARIGVDIGVGLEDASTSCSSRLVSASEVPGAVW